jgi:hypothetical protein
MLPFRNDGSKKYERNRSEPSYLYLFHVMLIRSRNDEDTLKAAHDSYSGLTPCHFVVSYLCGFDLHLCFDPLKSGEQTKQKMLNGPDGERSLHPVRLSPLRCLLRVDACGAMLAWVRKCRWDATLIFRVLAVCLAVFSLAACNEVSGDSSGGTIAHFVMRVDGPGRYDNYLPQFLLDFRDQHILTIGELLHIADTHCRAHGRHAMLNNIADGKLYFDCL